MQKIQFKLNASNLDVSSLDKRMKEAARLYGLAKQRGDSAMAEVYMNLYESLSDTYCNLLTTNQLESSESDS